MEELPEDRRGVRSFEDEARKQASLAGRSPKLVERYSEYLKAVNNAWLHAENSGLTAEIVRVWRQRNRKRVGWLSAETAGAEATFAMRGIVIRHALLDVKYSLAAFAVRNLELELEKLVVRESGVPVDGAGNADVVRQGRNLQGARADIANHEDAARTPSAEDDFIAAEDATDPQREVL